MIETIAVLIVAIGLAEILYCTARIIQTEIGSRRRMKKLDEWYQEELKLLEAEKERIRGKEKVKHEQHR